MISAGSLVLGKPGEDNEFCGLYYPDGDRISNHMTDRLQREPFYQSDKLYQVLPLVKHYGVAVDCGAWVGGWSRALAKRFDRVIAYEASSDNARCVRKNCPDNVEVHNIVVGEGIGQVSVAQIGVGSHIVSKGILAPLHSLDNRRELTDVKIDYMKIHVNGMELKALRGAKEVIGRSRPVLTVVLKPALADYGGTPEEARDLLLRWGYVPAGGERPYEIWRPV